MLNNTLSITNVLYKYAVIACIALSLSACSIMGNDESAPPNYSKQFIQTLNKGSLDDLVELMEFPFNVSNHQWEPSDNTSNDTPDNASNNNQNFSLTNFNALDFDEEDDFRLYFRNFIRTVNIQSEQGEYIPVNQYSQYIDELGPNLAIWSKLDAYVYLRGTGDVEHLIIVGVNPDSETIQAMYYN